jgi:integrase
MELTNWNQVFAAANRRCRKFRSDWRYVNVTPHTLRHTFAIHMLVRLSEAYFGSFVPGEIRDVFSRATREINRNPLMRLKELLGHRSVETTLKYLDYLEEAKAIVEIASQDLADATGGSWG